MLEKQPVGWPEEQLGTKLLQFIREMGQSLKKETLPHYFLSKRNMFENLPKHKLRLAQEKFHRFQESIIPHLILSIRGLAGEKGFYPTPDVTKLYAVLTSANALTMINPALLATSQGNSFSR